MRLADVMAHRYKLLRNTRSRLYFYLTVSYLLHGGYIMSCVTLTVLMTSMALNTLTVDPPKQYVDGTGIKFKLVPAGEFIMGSPISDDRAFDDEKPQHKVRITRAFYLSETEVTQTQYEGVMRCNPSRFDGADNPVEGITWNDAVEFCRKLSARERLKYRLPTEAEWEYACRADGSSGVPSSSRRVDLGKIAWFSENASGKTHRVRSKNPNAWGFFDMQGNVCEWCYDSYDPFYYSDSPVNDPTGPDAAWDRVCRGGHWNSSGVRCRPSARRWFPPQFPTSPYAVVGFRVVIELDGRFAPKVNAGREYPRCGYPRCGYPRCGYPRCGYPRCGYTVRP